MANNNNQSIWPAIFVCLFAGVVFQSILSGCGPTNTSSAPSSPVSVDRNSFEHRYAKERVKMEGYSDREAAQAADAIIKFHNAQKNR